MYLASSKFPFEIQRKKKQTPFRVGNSLSFLFPRIGQEGHSEVSSRFSIFSFRKYQADPGARHLSGFSTSYRCAYQHQKTNGW